MNDNTPGTNVVNLRPPPPGGGVWHLNAALPDLRFHLVEGLELDRRVYVIEDDSAWLMPRGMQRCSRASIRRYVELLMKGRGLPRPEKVLPR